jgi:hypothetical protein
MKWRLAEMTKQKNRELKRALRASKHNHRENRELVVGLIK